MVDAEKEIDISKVDKKNLPLTPAEEEIDISKVDAEKEIDISEEDKKNLPLTPAEKMVEIYNKTSISEKKDKSLRMKAIFIEIYYEILNNYKKYGSAITECEKEKIKNLINLDNIEKEVTYTEKDVEFLMNLYMDYTGDRREHDLIELNKFCKFPVQTQIEEMAELENDYYNTRPKKKY